MSETYDAGSKFGHKQQVSTSADASSTALDITAAPKDADKQIEIIDLIVSSAAAITVTVRSKTTHTNIVVFVMAANTTVNIAARASLKCADKGEAVEILTSGAGTFYVTCNYRSTGERVFA